LIWKHGEVFASHSTDLLTVALAFVKDHTPTASGAGARLASYLAPSPALLHALPYGSRVAVSDVVAEHDCDHRSPMFLLAGDHILLGSWNLTEHDGCNAIVYLNNRTEAGKLRFAFEEVWKHPAPPPLTQGQALAMIEAARQHNGDSRFLRGLVEHVTTRGALTSGQVAALQRMVPTFVPPPSEYGDGGFDF